MLGWKFPGSQVWIGQGTGMRKPKEGEFWRDIARTLPYIDTFLDVFFKKSLEDMIYCFAHLPIFNPWMSKAHLPKGKLISIC